MEVDRNGLEVLGRDECLRLRGTLGIGITSDALVTVLPFNFRFDGRQVPIPTGVGTKLDAATNNAWWPSRSTMLTPMRTRVGAWW
jgi:hypothetical protein